MDHSFIHSLHFFTHNQHRGSTVMVVTTAGPLRFLPKIERGLGTERARLGTFKKNLKKMLFFYSQLTLGSRNFGES